MSLGLYVSSFYFFRSGKNSCYLGLNAPVQYNDTQYSQAIDFFEDFFAVRRTMETIESEKKLYYIETNPNWRGETDKFSYIAACIHSGNYGIESDIYDATSHERVGSIEKNCRFSSSFHRTGACAFIWDFAAKLHCRTAFYRKRYSILFNIFDFFELSDCNQENSTITYNIEGTL